MPIRFKKGIVLGHRPEFQEVWFAGRVNILSGRVYFHLKKEVFGSRHKKAEIQN